MSEVRDDSKGQKNTPKESGNKDKDQQREGFHGHGKNQSTEPAKDSEKPADKR